MVYSAEDIPLATPQKVLSEPYNSTALNVSWRAVDESLEVMRGKLLGHRVRLLKITSTNFLSKYASLYK